MDDLLEAMRSRRSVREYLPEDIPDDLVTRILTAATWAPSAGNVQPWFFYVVRDHRLKGKMAEAALGQHFIARAPVVIVVCADLERASNSYGVRGKTLYCLQDTAAAIQNMLLAAQALGLGTCWVGAFSEDLVSNLLRLPREHRPLALVPLGRPGEKPHPPGRRPLEDVVAEVD